MIQINIGDHASTEVGYVAFPGGKRPLIQWARSRAVVISKKMPSADAYFRSLPGGRSLSQLLADRTIWINYSSTMPHYGEAVLSGKELCISETSCRVGRWTVLGTLVHELAHINGAPGNPSKLAEEALLHCGLGRMGEKTSNVDSRDTPYEPGISG
jgi:hypothetical protein